MPNQRITDPYADGYISPQTRARVFAIAAKDETVDIDALMERFGVTKYTATRAVRAGRRLRRELAKKQAGENPETDASGSGDCSR